jgi:hypothetical protein
VIVDSDTDLQFLSHAELVLWRLACSAGSSVLWLDMLSDLLRVSFLWLLTKWGRKA